jgi:hypothetical protein
VNRRAIVGLVTFIILVGAVFTLLILARRPQTVTFFFTGDTRGLLVPCGCSSVPSGGLARRTTMLEKFRHEPDKGEIIPVEIAHGFADRGPGRKLLNQEMARYFRREHYLVGVGSYDLLLGEQTLQQYMGDTPLYLAGGKGLPAMKTIQVGGWRLGPFSGGGETVHLVFLSQTAPGGVTLADPVEAFKSLEKIHPKAAYVVTGQLSPRSLQRLVKDYPNILAAVALWETDVTTIPQKGRNTWMVYLGDKGRRFATLSISREDGKWNVWPETAYLGPQIKSAPSVAKEVEAVLKKVEAVNKKALARTVTPAVAGEAFMGASYCEKCHAQAHKIWSMSHHADATKILAIDHQQDNPACLKCHATGLGVPGGYPNSKVDLSGVQCEACHGQGEGHPGKKKMIVPQISRESCGVCHDRRDSPKFDAEGFWQAIRHS